MKSVKSKCILLHHKILSLNVSILSHYVTFSILNIYLPDLRVNIQILYSLLSLCQLLDQGEANLTKPTKTDVE